MLAANPSDLFIFRDIVITHRLASTLRVASIVLTAAGARGVPFDPVDAIRNRFRLRILGEVLGMWTVIYIAPTARIAERIKSRLTEEGFLVQVRSINLTNNHYEILVPEGEVEDVQEVLSSILHR
jgi:hypothetical protein